MSTTLTLIDAGAGNLQSVHKALLAVGAAVEISDQPDSVKRAARIVLPGVGAFGDFMAGLRTRRLVEPLLEFAAQGKPLLGICVGMQALFDLGEELGSHPGLGLLPGRVVHFPDFPALTGERLKVPHTGWNQLAMTDEPLFAGLQNGDYAYFNHAYYCLPGGAADVAAWTTYGVRFASAVHRNNLFGVQFHPEKSQKVGLQILANFINL